MDEDVDIVGSDIDDIPGLQYSSSGPNDLNHASSALQSEDPVQNGDDEEGSTESNISEFGDDLDANAAAEAMAQQLGDALWAGITQAYSVPAESNPQQELTTQNSEQKIISNIRRILDYLSLNADIEAVFASATFSIGAITPEVKNGRERDVLSVLKSFSNTGVVNNETAAALACAVEKIADSNLFADFSPETVNESARTGGKRKRSKSEVGVKIEQED